MDVLTEEEIRERWRAVPCEDCGHVMLIAWCSHQRVPRWCGMCERMQDPLEQSVVAEGFAPSRAPDGRLYVETDRFGRAWIEDSQDLRALVFDMADDDARRGGA